MIVTFAPGKLYISGEYAVMSPNKKAILIAVDKFIKVILKEQKNGTIESFGEIPAMWHRTKGKIILEKEDERFNYIVSSINVVEKYALEKGKKLKNFSLKIESELESSNGKKYGLGSSAAVTVATIEALAKLYELNISRENLFKLSSIAHIDLKSNGSLGDLASSVYGGWIVYTSFDKKYIENNIKTKSISEVINLEWPYLSIQKLNPPADFKLLVGWTKNPSSTYHLVDKLRKNSRSEKYKYSKFLEKAEKSVENMIMAFKHNDLSQIQTEISVYRNLLLELGKNFMSDIETPLLKFFSDKSIEYGGSGKLSGAGGGDCAIAIFRKSDDINNLMLELESKGIKILKLNIYERGGN